MEANPVNTPDKDHADIFEISDVIKTEIQIITARRDRIRKEYRQQKGHGHDGTCGQTADTGSTLVGLALSGGGIRSAITNLGVLQGLARSGILRLTDLLSTVSGGGYIGGCLSSLLSMKHPGEAKHAPQTLEGDEVYNFSQGACSENHTQNDAEHDRVDKANTCAPEALFTTSWSSFPLKDAPLRQRSESESEMSLENQEKCDAPFISPFSPRDQMVHLRNRASYLIPRDIPMGSQVIKAIGSVMANTLLPLLWFMAAICALTAIYMLFVSVIYHNHPSSAGYFDVVNHTSVVHSPCARPDAESTGSLTLAVSGIARIASHQLSAFKGLIASTLGILIALAGIAAGLICPFCIHPGPAETAAEENPENLAERHFLNKTALTALTTTTILALICCLPGLFPARFEELLFIPALFCIGVVAGTAIYLVLEAGGVIGKWNRCTRSAIYLQNGIFLYATGFTLILALLPGFIIQGNPWILMLFQAAAAAGIRTQMSGNEKSTSKGDGSSQSLIAKAKGVFLNLLVPAFIFFAVIMAGSLVNSLTLHDAWPLANISGTFIFFTLVSIALFILLCTVNYNRISHHHFYRDRLAEAFLMSFAHRSTKDKKNSARHFVKLVRNAVEMPLSYLHGNMEDTANSSSTHGCACRGPYHLINATINLTAARDMKGFRRQSEIFLFSRCFIGSERTGFAATSDSRYRDLRVARALTVSGAAVTSVMGKAGSLLQSFACTILGVRLGYWLENPAPQAGSSGPGGFAAKKLKWGRLLALELIRYTHARGRYIYLSDGGHNGDNLGIIPLFQRRVRLVIASDAEHDPDYIFDSLNSSLRQAYVDYGIKVKITINRNNLEPDEKKQTKTHFVVGRILYPDRPWQASWLVVIKNSITGDELATILNYRKKRPGFPQESTGDQFFTEEQFEAYRALGRHTAADAFPQDTLEACSDETDPWLGIEKIGRELQDRNMPQEDSSGNSPGKGRDWDDLFQALWDTEQVDFSSWSRFSKTIPGTSPRTKSEHWENRISGSLPHLETQMEILEWSIANPDKLRIKETDAVPRSWKEFQDMIILNPQAVEMIKDAVPAAAVLGQ